RATDEGRGEEPERWHAALSQEHAAERGQKKERHDRGLRQRDEITDERTLLRRWAPRDRGEADNAAPQKACDGGMRAEGPRREATQRIRCADRDLHDKNHGGRDRERTEPRRIPSVTPCLDAREDHDDSDTSGDVSVEHRDRRRTAGREVDWRDITIDRGVQEVGWHRRGRAA